MMSESPDPSSCSTPVIWGVNTSHGPVAFVNLMSVVNLTGTVAFILSAEYFAASQMRSTVGPSVIVYRCLFLVDIRRTLLRANVSLASCSLFVNCSTNLLHPHCLYYNKNIHKSQYGRLRYVYCKMAMAVKSLKLFIYKQKRYTKDTKWAATYTI